MTVVTLTPDATITTSGISVTGAANEHSALADSSDSSYIAINSGDLLTVSLSDLTLPAGALIRTLTLLLRSKRTAAGSAPLLGFRAKAPSLTTLINSDVVVSWSSFADFQNAYTPASASELTETAVDDAQVDLLNTFSENIQVAKLSLSVTYVARPASDVTAPSGAVSNTNTPAVIWANTLDSDGGAQSKYEVKIFSAAQYGAGGFDPSTSTPTETSGVTASSAASWAPSDPLPDATYRAYVRVAQTVLGTDHWSDWAYEGFTVTANSPGVPTLTVTPQDDEGRILLTLDDTAGATTHAFEVQRSIDAGSSWETIRTTDGGLITPTAGVGHAFDTEVGNGVEVIYRARALNIITEFTTYSTWSASSTPDSWASTSWWLKSPIHPDLNIPVEMAGMDPLAQDANQGVFKVLGSRLPIVVSEPRSGFTGTVSFVFDDQGERAEFDELLDILEPLLLQAPPANHWEDRYVMLGNLSRARGIDKAFVEWTVETLSWTEVDPPAGDIIEWPAFAS